MTIRLFPTVQNLRREYKLGCPHAVWITMGWMVEYEPKTATVVLSDSGEIGDEDARAQTMEAVVLLKQNKARAVLADFSEGSSEISLPALYGLPDYASQLSAPWQTCIAVVLPRNRYRIETFHFFELVCRNAGYEARLFESRKGAEAWLTEVGAAREPLSPSAPA